MLSLSLDLLLDYPMFTRLYIMLYINHLFSPFVSPAPAIFIYLRLYFLRT